MWDISLLETNLLSLEDKASIEVLYVFKCFKIQWMQIIWQGIEGKEMSISCFTGIGEQCSLPFINTKNEHEHLNSTRFHFESKERSILYINISFGN